MSSEPRRKICFVVVMIALANVVLAATAMVVITAVADPSASVTPVGTVGSEACAPEMVVAAPAIVATAAALTNAVGSVPFMDLIIRT